MPNERGLAVPTDSTAHLPPLYPFLLAFVTRLLGDGPGSAAALTGLNVARPLGDPRPGATVCSCSAWTRRDKWSGPVGPRGPPGRAPDPAQPGADRGDGAMAGLCCLAGPRNHPSPGPVRLGFRRGRRLGVRALDRSQLLKPSFAGSRRAGGAVRRRGVGPLPGDLLPARFSAQLPLSDTVGVADLRGRGSGLH